MIGSSSLDYDVSRQQYPAWTHLPYITHPDFNSALVQRIGEFGIAGIYSPNPVVWNYLNQVLKNLAPEVRLVNDSPVSAELDGFRVARERANAWLANSLPLASALTRRDALSAIELAALLRHTAQIPGMCDDEKLRALCEIARITPAGDIVEIGSWWGKSAFVLGRLAHCHRIGKLLCVDPWSNEHLVQRDEKGLVDSGSALMDADEALTVFEMNLLPYNFNHVNYLRMPSTEGAAYYRANRRVTTDSFGTTEYRGQIAILHIDGNHSYTAVKADVVGWQGFVMPGGWLVIDDYLWPYGDGPKRAGDEFLVENSKRIEAAFVMGGALFIQLAA